MFKLVPFEKAHIRPLLEQNINADVKSAFIGGLADSLEKATFSFTGMWKDEVAFCGGVLPYWQGRGQTWSVFNENVKYSVPVIRGIRKFIEEQTAFNRLEACTPCGFDIGQRRMKLLGFKRECERAAKYLPDGTDCELYAWVRGEA